MAVTGTKGWTVKAHMVKFNVALVEYAKRFNKDHGEMIEWAALETVTRIEKRAPVQTGRYRAGWLPFLWANNKTAPFKSAPGAKGTAKARQEGVRACKYKSKFKGDKPYATITNAVRYGPYLEYGVRARALHGTKIKPGQRLYSVSKRSGRGHVRMSIAEVYRSIKAKLRKR